MFFGDPIRPTVIVVSFTLLLWLILTLVIKDLHKAGIITSIFLLLFFSYGHLWNCALGIFREMYLHLNENYFLLFWALVFIGSPFLVIKTRRRLHSLTHYLNIVSILLVAFPMITIVLHRLGSRGYRLREGQLGPVNLEESKKYPDIYYIILDGYARADILGEFYQYDNSEFLKFLAQKGFFIANKSRSNYSQTSLSLSSSLNSTYLDDLSKKMGPETNDRLPLRKMIWNNRVASFLKERGFLMVAFSSGIAATEIKNADIFITPPMYLSEFENLLLNTTPFLIILDELPEKSQYGLHRDRLLYIFDHLADPAKMDAPVFVFAHIMAPHRPFIFGENGEKVKPDREFSFAEGTKFMDGDVYVEKYRNQLIFVNKKIQMAINKIISKSSEPPIIILQADHGSGLYWCRLDKIAFKERMSILNAYYLPGSGHKKLYDEITPVNTFRVIFNHYFGTDLEILEDKCCYSTWQHPYKFIDVTDKINSD